MLVFTGSAIYLLYAVLSGYGWAWIGHYFIEKNTPATFKYPVWSLLSDFKLYFELITGGQSFKAK